MKPTWKVGGVLEDPDLVALLGLDHAGSMRLEPRGKPPLEDVGRLHQMVVRGEERVADRPGLGVRQQGPGRRALDPELDDAGHVPDLPAPD